MSHIVDAGRAMRITVRPWEVAGSVKVIEDREYNL
jgi:hypothetical protein